MKMEQEKMKMEQEKNKGAGEDLNGTGRRCKWSRWKMEMQQGNFLMGQTE